MQHEFFLLESQTHQNVPPHRQNNPGRAGWKTVMDYISRDTSIHEVILSGGDPLMASDDTLQEIIQGLDQMAHVSTLRIHSRIPIVLPERINQSLLNILSASSLHKVLVIHANHANEFDASVDDALAKMKQINCHLLNQSVLLRGINDDADVLTALSHRLFKAQVLPYYLHLLDKVDGAAHFDVSVIQAKKIHAALQTKLPGYLVPKLACEEPGKAHKTLII